MSRGSSHAGAEHMQASFGLSFESLPVEPVRKSEKETPRLRIVRLLTCHTLRHRQCLSRSVRKDQQLKLQDLGLMVGRQPARLMEETTSPRQRCTSSN